MSTNPGIFQFRMAQSRGARQAWHMNVGHKQGERGCGALDKRHRFIAIFGFLHIEARLSELLSHKKTDHRFIFNNEDAQRLSWSNALRSPLTDPNSLSNKRVSELLFVVRQAKPFSLYTSLRALQFIEGRRQ